MKHLLIASGLLLTLGAHASFAGETQPPDLTPRPNPPKQVEQPPLPTKEPPGRQGEERAPVPGPKPPADH